MHKNSAADLQHCVMSGQEPLRYMPCKGNGPVCVAIWQRLCDVTMKPGHEADKLGMQAYQQLNASSTIVLMSVNPKKLLAMQRHACGQKLHGRQAQRLQQITATQIQQACSRCKGPPPGCRAARRAVFAACSRLGGSCTAADCASSAEHPHLACT